MHQKHTHLLQIHLFLLKNVPTHVYPSLSRKSLNIRVLFCFAGVGILFKLDLPTRHRTY